MTRHTRQILHVLLPAAAVGIFCLAIGVIVREVHTISLRDVVEELRSLSPTVLTGSSLFALASYSILTLYDYLALQYVGAGLRYLRVAPVSFSAFAIGHNVGLSSLSGGAIRYRAYSLAGLSAARIALVVGFIPLTYGLGAAILLGVTLLLDPAALTALPLGKAWLQSLGVLLLVVPLLYVGWNALRRTPVTIGAWMLTPPGARLGLCQCLLGSADLVLASLVLYVLVHGASDISFLPFLGAYLLAMVAGVVSNVPGAVGVFESAMLLLLPDIPVAILLGSILAYRLIYYLVPLLLALMLVVAHEVVEHRAKLQQLSLAGMAWGTRVVPQVIGATVFFVGTYLLVGAAIPFTPLEHGLFGSLVPIPLLELAHLLSSAIGVGLLLLARGLFRRLHGAYSATVILLAVGSVMMFIHRDSMLQSALLLLILMLTWLSRAEFYRGRGLLDQRFDTSWVLSIVLVLVAAFGLGIFVHRHVEYSDQLWWQFALDGDAPRMLRASVLVLVIAGVFAVLRLIRGHPRPGPSVGTDELARARAIVASSPRSDANLALLGDKRFLFHPADDAVLMYQGSGRSFIAMGDPLGNAARFEELAWSFRELCDVNNTRCVFYEVADSCLPVYIDLGLSFSKLGEEARVDLREFDLEGSKRAALRHALNRSKRDGIEFAIVPAVGVPGIIDELKQVSDDWLQVKGGREKGFSLGCFDAAYLANFDCAVMRVDNRIVAFANLWQGAGREELSVDLMRFGETAPGSVMDALFTEVMLWGREQGYAWFSLGMAPLAGLDQRSLSPAWNKLGNLAYRYGEHFYNFDGLRQYKQKFEPEWSPRYLACRGGLDLPAVLYDAAVLIAGGVKGIFPD